MNRAVTTRPFREHEITLYYTNGIHTFDSGPSWPVQHSGMHGHNIFFLAALTGVRTSTSVEKTPGFATASLLQKKPQWYKTKAAVYLGKRTATLHMEDDGRTVSWVESHDPIEWCTITILNHDLEQRGAFVKRRRAVSR